MTYQQTLKLLGLSDVNPAVFFNDFDVFHFVVESVESKHHRQREREGRLKKKRNILQPERNPIWIANQTHFVCAKVVAKIPHVSWLMSSAVVNIKCLAVCQRD